MNIQDKYTKWYLVYSIHFYIQAISRVYYIQGYTCFQGHITYHIYPGVPTLYKGAQPYPGVYNIIQGHIVSRITSYPGLHRIQGSRD